MERQEALERMREIQRIVERTALYTLLPGAPAVIGGILALIGYAASYVMIRSFDFAQVASLSVDAQFGFCFMWFVIGVVAIVQDLAFTVHAARKLGFPQTRPGRFSALSLTPSVFVAAVLTIQLLLNGHMNYIAPVWMMCYGTGVYAAGLFSVRLPRLLGAAFIVVGAITLLLLPEYGLLLTALSFGALHIVFGLLVIRKRRRENHR